MALLIATAQTEVIKNIRKTPKDVMMALLSSPASTRTMAWVCQQQLSKKCTANISPGFHTVLSSAYVTKERRLKRRSGTGGRGGGCLQQPLLSLSPSASVSAAKWLSHCSECFFSVAFNLIRMLVVFPLKKSKFSCSYNFITGKLVFRHLLISWSLSSAVVSFFCAHFCGGAKTPRSLGLLIALSIFNILNIKCGIILYFIS